MKEKHIYIIGSKGIPAKYGGFETFVEELTTHQSNKKLKYHVACLSNDIKSNFIHNGADCFNIPKKNIGRLYFCNIIQNYNTSKVIILKKKSRSFR